MYRIIILLMLVALPASALAQSPTSPPSRAFAPRIPYGDKDGEAFLEAAQKGDDVKILTLLKKGIPVDSQDSGYGVTALQLAAGNRHPSTVKLLLDHGSDVHIETYRGINGDVALWEAAGGLFAITPDNPGPVFPKVSYATKALQEHYHKLVFRILDDWLKGDCDIIQMLLAHGANVNAKLSKGETVLMQAAFGGNTSMIQLLIAHGATINTQDNNGETALIKAAMMPTEPDKLAILLNNGANPKLRDKEGRDALYYAQQNPFNKDVVQLLKHATGK